jgi:hypothetical protein
MITHRVTVEFDDATYQHARRLAEQEGLSLEEWLTGRLSAICTPPSRVDDRPDAPTRRNAPRAAHASPEGAPARAQPATPEAVATPVAEVTVHSRLARLPAALVEQAQRNPAYLEVLLFPYQPGESPAGGASGPYPIAAEIVDLAGAWDGLHYLLSPLRRASSAPVAGEDLFSLAIYGAAFGVNMPDIGYAPPGHLPPEEVAAISATLASLSPKALRDAYQPREMDAAQVYPLAWERDGVRGLEYLLYYFELLRDFYARAAADRQAVVFCLW